MCIQISLDGTCVDLDDGQPPELRAGRLFIFRMADLHEVLDDALEVRHHDICAGSDLLGTIIYRLPQKLGEFLKRLSPQCAAYEAIQMQLYEAVAGRAHNPGDEGHVLADVGGGPPQKPMPFYMEPAAAGRWTVAYGHLLEKMAPKPGERILEIGYGQGGLTELLVRAGLDVTAVELHPSAATYLDRRIQALGLSCRTITGSITEVTLDGKFDKIVFFESFHHLPSFERTLRSLIDYLAPGGSIVFGAEPIVPDCSLEVPFPWGLRLDGGALSAARDVGWLEIGFQRSFFFEMLHRLGLEARESMLPSHHHSHLIIASRISA